MKQVFLMCCVGLISGCSSFGENLANFNTQLDRFDAAYERELWAQEQEARSHSWGIVEGVRLVNRASLVRGEPPRQMQELTVRVAGRTNDVRVLYLPLESAPYRVGATIYLR